ncbi:MAG: twin-arginine translocation signal domain-containing protein [Chloroflexales bacterium]|nr:twin-arginine translocation signal domain-containing protein [Chloroflexales bacterium]
MAVQNRSRRDFLRQVTTLGVSGLLAALAIACLLQILQKNQ